MIARISSLPVSAFVAPALILICAILIAVVRIAIGPAEESSGWFADKGDEGGRGGEP